MNDNPVSFQQPIRKDLEKILTLPDTILAPPPLEAAVYFTSGKSFAIEVGQPRRCQFDILLIIENLSSGTFVELSVFSYQLSGLAKILQNSVKG